ncbi:MAG: hypothetical protein ACR2NL_06780 [Acidimicrobiia bacterium]
MADRLVVPEEDLKALAGGERIVAFASRHEVDLNDELELVAGILPDDSATLPAGLVGLVVGLQPAASMSGDASVIALPGDVQDGDAVILRVFVGTEPALTDAEFESRRAAVEAMFG